LINTRFLSEPKQIVGVRELMKYVRFCADVISRNADIAVRLEPKEVKTGPVADGAAGALAFAWPLKELQGVVVVVVVVVVLMALAVAIAAAPPGGVTPGTPGPVKNTP
jgi:hypothetical protein